MENADNTVKESPAIQYANELKEDLKLTLSNLREKSLTTSSMKAKWIGYMAKEKEALARLSSVRLEYQKTLMSKMKGANAFDKLKLIKAENWLLQNPHNAKNQGFTQIKP